MQATPVQAAGDQFTRFGQALDRIWDSLTGAGFFEELIILLLAAAAILFVSRLTRRAINHQIEDVNRRHQLRKIIKYAT